jgi:endonuclease/exonuclease/phosphatase family metal-dependent hydrolase
MSRTLRLRQIVFAMLLAQAHLLQAQDLKVLTWNIRYDNPEDSLDRWDLRKGTLARFVLDTRPAIVGLQEGLAHQLKYLDAEWPGYRRVGVGREDGVERGEFCPIYYDTARFTLLTGRTYWLAPNPDRPGKGWDAVCERIATFIELRDARSGDTIAVMNTHWDHVSAMARLNSAALVRRVLNPLTHAGTPVILMGDLNAEPGTTEIGLIQQWLTDACPQDRLLEPTFNGFALDGTKAKHIDYVWVSNGDFKVRRYEVPHPSMNGRHASDHFPVLVELQRVDH